MELIVAVECFLKLCLLFGKILLMSTSTKSSLSGRLCSCQKPMAWPISCRTIPKTPQPLPSTRVWAPPTLPTLEQQLKREETHDAIHWTRDTTGKAYCFCCIYFYVFISQSMDQLNHSFNQWIIQINRSSIDQSANQWGGQSLNQSATWQVVDQSIKR